MVSLIKNQLLKHLSRWVCFSSQVHIHRYHGLWKCELNGFRMVKIEFSNSTEWKDDMAMFCKWTFPLYKSIKNEWMECIRMWYNTQPNKSWNQPYFSDSNAFCWLRVTKCACMCVWYQKHNKISTKIEWFASKTGTIVISFSFSCLFLF